MKRLIALTAAMLLALGMMASPAMADGHHAMFGDFPSTNELNRDKQVPGREGQDAPHVNLLEATPGSVTLEFVNEAPGVAYFEHRIDGEALDEGAVHPIAVGSYIYPGTSVESGNTLVRTFEASEKVEIRLALGGERDWDFDWTTFEVEAAEPTKDDCKDGGFDDMGFRNQGQCVASFRANENAGPHN